MTADLGLNVRCRVTATNSGGVSALAASAETAIPTAPTNTVAPVVSGTTVVGQTLSTTNGTWSGTATITYGYQWRRDGFGNSVYADIPAATGATYLLADADDDCKVLCAVTATNGGGAVLIGGDYQGKNPDVPNARAVYISPEASIRADATAAGDGSRPSSWAISAQ